MNWTSTDIDRLKQRGFQVIDTTEKKAYKILPAKSKYGNKETEVNGIKFDSKKEAYRYKELLLLQKYGEIGMLELQVPFELNKGGTHSLIYIADFVYIDAATGKKIVEDVKGFRTKVYLKKKRLMKKVHGIVINEI